MTTLNNLQYQSYSIALQLARLLRKSKRMYNKVTPFHNEVEHFLHNLDSIPVQASIKAKKGTGITTQKRDLKKEIAREATNIGNLVNAYAHVTKNKALTRKMTFTYSHIFTLKDCDVLARITSITNEIKPLLTKEDFKGYGITAGTLTSIIEKAKEFNSRIGLGKMVNFKSYYASQTITATLKKIKVNITQMTRLLLLFKESNPGFINDFQQALIISQANKNHNTIEGIITDNNTAQPLQNVTITVEGTTKTTITNAAGFYQLQGIKTGVRKFTITADGYTTQTLTTKIIRGKMVNLNIHLQAKHLNLAAAEVA